MMLGIAFNEVDVSTATSKDEVLTALQDFVSQKGLDPNAGT
jgi:hypothetical protein